MTRPAPHSASGLADPAWRRFWLAALALQLLVLVPVATTRYPAIVDYPNHLARIHVLTGLLPGHWQQLYGVRGVWIPNLAVDLICPPLVHLGLDPNTALHVFVGLTLVLLSGAALFIAVVLQRQAGHAQPPWLVLLVFMLAYNRYLVLGLLNFLFSLAVALLAFGGWLLLRQPGAVAGPARLGGLLLVGLGVLASLLAHMTGFGVFLLVAGAWELGAWLQADKRRAAAWRPVLVLAAVVAPAAAAYLFLFDKAFGFSAVWQRVVYSKVSGALSPWLAYRAGVAAVFLLLTLTLIAWVRRGQTGAARPRWSVPAWLALGTLVLAFLLLPTSIMGGDLVDKRLSIAVAVLALAFATAAWTPRQARALLAGAVLLGLAKVGEVQWAWWQASPVFAAIRQAFQAVPLHARVVSFSFARSDAPEFPPLRHAAGFAVIDRAAYLPSLFAFPGFNMSIAQKTVPPGTERLSWGGTRGPGAPVDWAAYCQAYDHVLVTFEDPLGPLHPCLQAMVTGAGFVLYATRRP